jgi:diguanylate cyclase (GGDEF)-like protein/PAS domain S-box-containing protein
VTSAIGAPEGPEFFETAFMRAPAAIALIGVDGRMLRCNPAYCELVGLPAEQVIGADATRFVHPDDIDAAIASSVEQIELGRAAATRPKPIRIVRPDGSFVWVKFDSMLIEDGPGDPYVLATMTDVSEQVESEAAQARSEAWLRALLQHQSDIVTVVGFDGMLRYISPNCERLIGFTAEELADTSGLDNIHPDDVDALVDGLAAQLDDGQEARPIQYRQRCRDGSWRWLEATGREVPSELGSEAVIVNARDVSERMRAEAARRETAHRFQIAFATSPIGIGFADLDGRITWVNRALAKTVGVPEAELLTMRFQDFSRDDELARELAETRRLLHGEIDSYRVEKRYEHPDGRTVWALLHVSLVRDADGSPAQLLGQLEDITERKQLESTLTHDALHDPLTGLLNRTGLRAQVDLAWGDRRAEAPMAILFGDLDGFKHVNDMLGHDAGDEVLVLVAHRLREAVRDGDIVARWGGDEFVILCPSVRDAHAATRIAQRICESLHEEFRIAPGPVGIGISIGVALDEGQPLPDLLIKDADAAAYRAKVAGRNRVEVA